MLSETGIGFLYDLKAATVAPSDGCTFSILTIFKPKHAQNQLKSTKKIITFLQAKRMSGILSFHTILHTEKVKFSVHKLRKYDLNQMHLHKRNLFQFSSNELISLPAIATAHLTLPPAKII